MLDRGIDRATLLSGVHICAKFVQVTRDAGVSGLGRRGPVRSACAVSRLRRHGRPRPRLPVLQDRRGRDPRHDRRRGRAHRRVHGHQPGDARPRARRPAHARRATCCEIGDEDLAAVARRGAAPGAGARASALGADGVNLLNSCGAAAWQTVFHFHIHVIPRYADDPLRLPWMPAPGRRGRDRRPPTRCAEAERVTAPVRARARRRRSAVVTLDARR